MRARGRLLRAAYRLTLWLYPPEFRRRYGRQIEEDALRLWSEARGARAHRVRTLRRLILDAAQALPTEWAVAIRRRREWPEGRLAATRAAGIDAIAALRSLGRRPRFTIGVTGLLAVGIGACVAVTSIMSAYVLRPLPYPEADRLVTVSPAVPVNTSETSDLFEISVSWDLDVYTLLDADGPEMVYGSWISAGYAELFGLSPALGRLFDAEESVAGGPSVAVISHELWQRRYGGDPNVIGKRLSAFTSDRPDDAETFTIVGVLAADSWLHSEYADFLTPLREDRTVYAGRLRPGVHPIAAADVLADRARERLGEAADETRVRLVPLQERYTATLRPVLRIATATVLLALLIACGNTAALLLVRAAHRNREFAIRQALGARDGRLARQLLFEGFLLAGGAAVVGLALAAGGLSAFGETLETQLGLAVPGGVGALTVDARALVVAVALSVGTGLVFGLTPLVGTLRRRAMDPAVAGMRGGSLGRSRRRTLQLIVAGGVGLSLTLIVPAALALQSARHAANLDPGFDAGNVFTGGVLLRAGTYSDDASRADFFQRLVTELARLPRVREAGVGIQLPFEGEMSRRVEPAMDDGSPGAALEVRAFSHDERLLETLRIPVLSGRGFGPDDGPGGEPVAMVSRELGERLWPGESPIGKRLRIRRMDDVRGTDPAAAPWLRVVGVVAGVRMSLTDNDRLVVHRPMSQSGSAWGTIALRLDGDAPPPLTEIRRTIAAIDPTLALSDSQWLGAAVAEAGQPARFLASLLSTFAAFAIAVAVVGLYAVMSFAAARRTRDVAIRMAVGARATEVAGLFLREGLALVAAGIMFGTAGAVVLSRGLESQLHLDGGTSPATYALCASLLALAGGLATWVPARRASRSDPMHVLRAD